MVSVLPRMKQKAQTGFCEKSLVSNSDLLFTPLPNITACASQVKRFCLKLWYRVLSGSWRAQPKKWAAFATGFSSGFHNIKKKNDYTVKMVNYQQKEVVLDSSEILTSVLSRGIRESFLEP